MKSRTTVDVHGMSCAVACGAGHAEDVRAGNSPYVTIAGADDVRMPSAGMPEYAQDRRYTDAQNL